jgi:signal transduction histidine kinase
MSDAPDSGAAAPASLPHVETDLLVATCTPGGELVFRNDAWQTVFGDDEENPWARLQEGDRREITTALNRAAGGSLVTNHLCQVHLPDRDEPVPLLMNFLPVYLSAGAVASRAEPEDGPERNAGRGPRPVQAVTVTGEVMAEPASWTPSQTQRHRMEALGRMTMGVAHDLNNLLSALLGHAELLQKRVEQRGDAGALSESVQTIEQVAVDGAALVEKIQRYSRREGQSEFETLDLSALIEGCLTLTRPYWYNEPRRQGIAIELERDLHVTPPVRGVATELREVFVNLILNAVQAMPEGGRLTLRTGYDEGRGVRAEVEDTGAGMSADVREHVFEPFFTTKGEHGSGMGLSVSYGIVQEHDGDIQVDSALGRGTRFTLFFPAVEEEPAGDEAPKESAPPSRRARVLIVDDEKRVRSVLGKLLGLKGHTVEQATSGAEALALTENSGFDIVFTDYGMPAMNGRQLARALRRRTPHLPIVLLTGDADLEADANVDRVMSKPFTLDGLEAAIQELL